MRQVLNIGSVANDHTGDTLRAGGDKINDNFEELYAQPRLTSISSAPSSFGNWDSIVTAFDGDLSHVASAIGHQITGAATLGQPTSGYVYTPEAYPFVTYLYNSSGFNHATASSAGRTAAVAHRTYVYQAGQGDAVAYNATAFVTGAKGGASSFLANPAASLFNGDMSAGNAGVYENAGEFSLSDGGFDVAAIGWVINLSRTVASAALNTYWAGFRTQSKGSAYVDDAFVATGKVSRGLNTIWADLGSNKAAIALAADQRVYGHVIGTDPDQFAVSSLGTDYWSYNSSLSAWEFVVNNVSALQIYTSLVLSPLPIRTTKHMAVADGITGPGGTTDQAKIYVDIADGSLKVVFGNNTVKTLATNP